MGLYQAVPTLNAEITAWRKGRRHVAGVDEVGCGPLAGPLLAGAVILDPSHPRAWWSELRDSKMLELEDRERLAEMIRGDCAHAIGIVSHEFIDTYGLTAARKTAMRHAIDALPCAADMLLIDAVVLPEHPHRAIIHGDAHCASIAAASIVAKVARDRIMADYHREYPHYGFEHNRGYSTPEHHRALDEHGPCDIHRRLFAPVRTALESRGIRVETAEIVDPAAIDEDALEPALA